MVLNPFYSPQYVRFEQLAPAYDSTATYSVGDYVTYEYNLYQCTTAVTTAGAFDPSKWNMVDVTDQLTDDLTIASSTTGINPSITDSADGLIQDLTVYGRSRVSKNLCPVSDVSYLTTFTWTSLKGVPASNITDGTKVTLSSGNYYVKLRNASNIQEIQIVTANSTIIYNNLNEGAFSLAAETTLYIRIKNQANNTQTSVQIMLETGTEPSPYEPYGIISIGDSGSLTITTTNSDNTESSTATLTSGLPISGIPVTTDETYTDEDGQKWLADTASVEGVTKRCCKITFDGSENWSTYSSKASASGSLAYLINNLSEHSVVIGDRDIPNAIGNYLSVSIKNDLYYGYNDNSFVMWGAYFAIRVSGIATAADLKTYLSNNPLTVVYELEIPTTQELTSSEKSALLSLKTYDSTTNLVITDDPYVDFSYLKNTDNGQAVADIQNALNEQKADKVYVDDKINDTTSSNTTAYSSNKVNALLDEKIPPTINIDGVKTKLNGNVGISKPVTFTGLTVFQGQNVWTDGENIYYSSTSNQYVFDKNTLTWSAKTWTGLTSFEGYNVWTDGEDIYYSSGTTQYILDTLTSTWSAKTWNGLTDFNGMFVWTEGTNIYYSNMGANQYILNKDTSTWESVTWYYSPVTGATVWSDGENTYCLSSSSGALVFDQSNSKWVLKTWYGYQNASGIGTWTDGTNIYYWYESNSYVLDKSTSTWIAKTWDGLTSFYGEDIWTDGENIYYSHGTTHKRLIPNPPIKSVRLR